MTNDVEVLHCCVLDTLKYFGRTPSFRELCIAQQNGEARTKIVFLANMYDMKCFIR